MLNNNLKGGYNYKGSFKLKKRRKGQGKYTKSNKKFNKKSNTKSNKKSNKKKPKRH